MNTIQIGSMQVREAVIAKELTIRDNLAAKARKEWETPFRVEAAEKFDLSKLSDEEQKMFDEELQKHNEQFAFTGKYLKFRFDEEAKTSYVEVINSATHEVIVTLPPEFLIDLSLKMKKILGIYIDEKL